MVTVSAFDFDGTVFRGDSLPLFIKHVAGGARFYRLLTGMSARLVLAKMKIIDPDRVKERLLCKVIRRMPEQQLQQYAYTFHLAYKHRLRADAMCAMEHALSLGHRVVVITASPEIWVRRFFPDRRITVIGTGLEVVNGQLTGRFSTPNCIGPEKVRRLDMAFPPSHRAKLIAYGDSRGDRELLSAADESHYKTF